MEEDSNLEQENAVEASNANQMRTEVNFTKLVFAEQENALDPGPIGDLGARVLYHVEGRTHMFLEEEVAMGERLEAKDAKEETMSNKSAEEFIAYNQNGLSGHLGQIARGKNEFGSVLVDLIILVLEKQQCTRSVLGAKLCNLYGLHGNRGLRAKEIVILLLDNDKGEKCPEIYKNVIQIKREEFLTCFDFSM